MRSHKSGDGVPEHEHNARHREEDEDFITLSEKIYGPRNPKYYDGQWYDSHPKK